MKCTKCNAELEENDNFCSQCGEWTAKGYNFLKDEINIKNINNGLVLKQKRKIKFLVNLLSIGIITFFIMLLCRGDNLFKPLIYLKKEVNHYVYGYYTSTIKTDNKYYKKIVNTYEEATDLIKNDFLKQEYTCQKKNELIKLEYDLETDYLIPSVMFCDMDYNEVLKIKNVIQKMYNLFPNIKGTLTNITLTNASSKSEYIAYFQPMYQFVNINESINNYNKVNKTQILLNSYYFLNQNILNVPIQQIVGESWYVKDANWESTIAHELGHYITFVILLKDNQLENITLETKNNTNAIKKVIEEFESGKSTNDIVLTALNNYNNKYNTKLNIDEFAKTISQYASTKDSNGDILANETIAEAIHDYFLHQENMQKSSAEIITIIKGRLGL